MLANQIIRQELKLKRQKLCLEEYEALSLLCYRNLQNWPLFQQAKRIGLYCSTNREVNTMTIIQDLVAQQKTLLLPKIIGEGEMTFCEVKDLTMLEEGTFHILSPNEICPISDSIDLLIIPLTGYDQNGYRLGMGGGYYDRYLTKHHLISCGLAFSFQKCTFDVYPHDQKMNYLVNEKELLTFA